MTTLIFTKEKIDSLNEKNSGSILIVLNEQATKSKKEPGMLVSLYREDGQLRPFSIGVDDEEKSWPGVIGADKKYAPIKDGQHVAFKNNDGEYEIFKFKKIKDEKGTGFFFVELTSKGLEAKATDGKGDIYIAYSDSKPAFDPKTAAFVEATPLFKKITGKAQEVVTPQPVAPASPLAGLGDKAETMPKVKESKLSLVVGGLKKAWGMSKGAAIDIIKAPISPFLGAGDAITAARELRKDNPVKVDDEKEQTNLDNKRKGGLIARGILGLSTMILGSKVVGQTILAVSSMFSSAPAPNPNITVDKQGMPMVALPEPPTPKTPFPSSNLLLPLALMLAARGPVRETVGADPNKAQPKGR